MHPASHIARHPACRLSHGARTIPQASSAAPRQRQARRFAAFSLLTLAAGLIFALTARPAAAQMQIPNPLIRPRSLVNPATLADPATPAADVAGRAATPATYATGNGPIALNANGTPASTEDPYLRNLAELKDRFANFYVSAIVGKHAMLRRSGAARSGGTASATPAQPAGTSMAPISLTAGAGASQGRSDAMMLADGDLLDSVGTTGALVAKVARSQVAIYHVQETMVLPGGKLVGKRVIVFTGELESSGAANAPGIVLERPDPAYKRMITVETKGRSTASSTTAESSAGGSTAPATPSTQTP